ncbi:hypothetical protein PCK2_000188 [Pneumocystis canis]|nr:hypothetical protein PCK2_000188 [Pneumocystis canis]
MFLSLEDVKKLCLTQLEEFLRKNTFSFVEDLFNALEKKTYLNDSIQTKESLIQEKDNLKKRFFHQTYLDTYHRNNGWKKSRFIKTNYMNYGNWRPSLHQKAWFPDIFPFSPDFPMNSRKQRCKDYEEKGYCMRGDMCPYDHGVDHIVMDGQYSDAYDPTQSILPNYSMINSGPAYKNSIRSNSEHFSRIHKGNSSIIQGPNHDKTITTLSVENIPNGNLNEESIHMFFRKFGEISKITLEKEHHRAILKFKDWKSANRAWSSSAPIFNNRFVKLFWKISETDGKNHSQKLNDVPSNESQKPLTS